MLIFRLIQMSLNSDKDALPSQKNVWEIDSADFKGNLNPVNDKGTHWSLTLTEATKLDELLEEINNTQGWAKVSVRVTLRWHECVGYDHCISS